MPGATSARGVPEYAFNLALAQEIADAARQIGIRAVLLDDAARGPFRLSQRPLAAARRGATLFLSIHHDSVQPRYIETWVHDGQERRFSDRYRGYSLFVSARSSRLKESRDLADRIGDGLLGAGLKPTLHHAEDIPGERKPLLDARRGVYRYDNLIVLHRSPLPAVLVEAGVIVHRDEELVLAQPQFRARFAAAVARAVAAYCRR